jgi:hypothetical protein
MKPGHWVLLVLGVLLTVAGLALTISAAVILGASAVQGDGRYLTGPTEQYQSTGYALVGPSVDVDAGAAGMPNIPGLGDLASFQVRVTPVVPDQEVFVGIAEASEAAAYLEGVSYTSLGDASRPDTGDRPGRSSWFDDDDEVTSEGDRVPAPPGEQDFWTESTSGSGPQQVAWDLQPGRWSLVVMNADASRPVWVEVQAGARSDVLGPAGSGLLIAGLVGLVIGIPLLLLGSAGLGRDIDPDRSRPGQQDGMDQYRRPGQGPGAAPAGNAGWGRSTQIYPVLVAGFLDGRLSRWLWLVKWLLAIPHYIVLAVLWIAVLVATIAAGIVILFTGRYPRSWFWFNVGVLRWSWRVGFYGYSALGTDRYPPFTLAAADYPADLDVVYPQRLSHWLVLVKWWLLAIPHLLIVGIFTSGTGAAWDRGWGRGWGEDAYTSPATWGPSLLGLLVLITAVILLFSGRYRQELFDLIVGINRWAYRVAAYVLLMRDEYPPFRLDQGPVDPSATAAAQGPVDPYAPPATQGPGNLQAPPARPQEPGTPGTPPPGNGGPEPWSRPPGTT